DGDDEPAPRAAGERLANGAANRRDDEQYDEPRQCQCHDQISLSTSTMLSPRVDEVCSLLHTVRGRPRVMLGAWNVAEPPANGDEPPDRRRSRRSTRRPFSIRRACRRPPWSTGEARRSSRRETPVKTSITFNRAASSYRCCPRPDGKPSWPCSAPAISSARRVWPARRSEWAAQRPLLPA